MFNGHTFNNIEKSRHSGMNSIKTVAVNNLYMYIIVTLVSLQTDKSVLINGILRGGADKSLARPPSRCRRTELIVSLERRACSGAELQVFSF